MDGLNVHLRRCPRPFHVVLTSSLSSLNLSINKGGGGGGGGAPTPATSLGYNDKL